MTTEFGTDISCTTSLQTGRLSKGVRVVAEAAFRRITTPRGMLLGGEEEANYGIDLSTYIGKEATKDTVASLPAIIRAELSKDERILTVVVDVVAQEDGPLVTLNISIECTTNEGPFALQLAVTKVETSLLGITTDGAS